MSKKSKKTKGSLFSIHLMEDERGHITVITEAVGYGENSHTIGHQLLSRLTEIELIYPSAMTVQMPVYSEHRH